MAANGVAAAMLVEVDGDASKLGRELKTAEGNLAKFSQSTKGLGAEAGQLGGKYAAAAVQVSSATENMARAGAVTGEAMKQVITQGASVAFMFGPAGAIVAAIGISLLAVTELFQRSRKEMEETAKKARDELRALRRGSLENTSDLATRLYSGDRDAETEAEQRGVGRLREQKRQLEADIAKIGRSGAGSTPRAQRELGALTTELRETEKLLGQVEKRYVAVMGVQREQVAAAVDLEQTRRGRETAEAAADKARSDRTSAASKAEASARTAREKAITEANKKLDLFRENYAKTAARVSQAVAESTATLVDDMQFALDGLITELAEAGASADQIGIVRGIESAKIRVRSAVESIDALLAAVGDPDSLNGMTAAFDKLVAAEIELVVARDKATKGSAEAAGIEAQRVRVTEKRAALAEKIAKFGVDASKAELEGADKVKTTLERQASVVGSILSGVLQLASAFGLADSKAAKLAQSALTIAQNLSKAATGDPAAIFAVAASAVNIGKTLFTESAEQKARRRTSANNERAFAELAKRDGDLAALDLAGSEISNARNAVRQLVNDTAWRKSTDVLKGTTETFARMGVKFEDLQTIAASLGITIDDSVDGYRRLDQALRAADLKAFVDSFAGQMEQLDAVLDVDNVTDPAARLAALGDVLKKQSTAFAAILADATLTTVDGLASARARARETLARAIAGDIDVAEMGGLSPAQFIKALRQFIGEIDDTVADISPEIISIGERLARTLDTLDDDFEILETSAADRATKLADVLTGISAKFFEVFDGLDLGNPDDAKIGRDRLKDLYTRAGELTDAERGGLSVEDFRAAIRRIFGTLGDAIDEGTREIEAAEEQAQRDADARRQKRSERLTAAGAESDFFDEDAVERFQRQARAAASIFPELAGLLDGIDLTTPEGIETFNDRLTAFWESLEGTGALAGLSAEDLDLLRSVLGGLETGADGAAAALLGTASAMDVLTESLDNAIRDARRLGEDETAAGISTFLDVDELRAITGDFDPDALGAVVPALDKLRTAYRSATGTLREQIGAFIDYLSGLPGQLADDLASASSGPAAPSDLVSIAQSATGITSVDAVTLADVVRSGLVIAREHLEVDRAGWAALRDVLASVSSVRAGFVPPSLPGYGTPAAGSIAGELLIRHVFSADGTVTPGSLSNVSHAELVEFVRRAGPLLSQFLANNADVLRRLGGTPAGSSSTSGFR